MDENNGAHRMWQTRARALVLLGLLGNEARWGIKMSLCAVSDTVVQRTCTPDLEGCGRALPFPAILDHRKQQRDQLVERVGR